MSDLLNEASLVFIPSGIKASKVYAQIPEDASGDMTFSRASDATRVNSLGLVEKVRTNKQLYSEDFSNVTGWAYNNAITISTNVVENPLNGTTNADKITPTTATDFHQVRSGLATPAGYDVISVYVKSAGYNYVQLTSWADPTNYVNFDLTDGTIGTVATATIYGITSVGNGWYRVWANVQASGGGIFGIGVVTSKTAGWAQSFAGNGTDGIYLWGAQLEISDFGPTAYIPTTSSAVSVGPYSNIPRLNYQNGGGGCPSLLLEAQRTNLLTYSEQMNNGAYGKGDGIAVGSNVEVSPDGYQDADKIYTNTTVNGDHYFNRNPFTSVSSSTAYTFSIFAKKGEFNYINFESTIENNTYKGATINLNNGAVTNNTYSTTPLVENYGNGWYRISISGTTGASQTSVDTYIIVLNNSQQRFYTGDGVSGIYTWGWQLEAGSYVSSYIPTLGTSVTRVADECSKNSIGALIGGTSGTVFFDITTNPTLSSASYKQLCYYFDSASAQSYMYLDGANLVRTNSNWGSLASSALQPNTRYKIALTYATNDFALYINGSSVATASSGTPKNNVSLSIGQYGGVEMCEFVFNQYTHFPTRLTNAQLAELTA